MKLMFNFDINDKFKNQLKEYLNLEYINTDKEKYIRYLEEVDNKDCSEWSKGLKDEVKIFLFQNKCGFNLYNGEIKQFSHFN